MEGGALPGVNIVQAAILAQGSGPVGGEMFENEDMALKINFGALLGIVS